MKAIKEINIMEKKKKLRLRFYINAVIDVCPAEGMEQITEVIDTIGNYGEVTIGDVTVHHEI